MPDAMTPPEQDSPDAVSLDHGSSLQPPQGPAGMTPPLRRAPLIRGRDLYRYGLLAIIFGILGIFLIWPILLTVAGGFTDTDGGFTLSYLLSIFNDPIYMKGLANSLLIATFTTLLCLVITLPLAIIATKFDFPGKVAISSLILVPLILPPFVGAIGLRALLGRFGAINTLLADIGLIDPNAPGIDFLGGALGGQFWSVVVMEALHLYPIIYLNISASLANLDPALDEAAVNLGASRWKRFWKCTFPLIVPGIFAGATIVFIWSFTELGTPLMFDYYNVTPVQVFWGINEISDNPRPYALVVVMLVVAIALYMLGKFIFGGKAYEMQAKASVAAQVKRLTGFKGLAALTLFVTITLLAVLPHIGVILSSFSADGSWYKSILPSEFTLSHYSQALTHDLAMDSIRNSLIYALAAMVFCAIIGIAISYLTVRVKVRGSFLLDSLAMLPLAVPGLVMAFGYVAMSLKWPFGEKHILGGLFSVVGENPNPVPLLIIAYTIRRLPYIVRSTSSGLQQTSGLLEEAALNLGASTMTSIRRVVVPLIMANIIAGSILVFSFAMLEVSDSLILAQQEGDYPITKAIWTFYSRLGDGPYIASAMGVWGMALLTVTLVGASVLMGKKLGAIFRV
ncbi:ABC transporter permease [Poriferisphaera sp. WC338]|uniref:ABC transporter permease n=1 Tax=Poriferisphaera sp. WC338 TaxID=3425129 RepID=UPI003D814E07